MILRPTPGRIIPTAVLPASPRTSQSSHHNAPNKGQSGPFGLLYIWPGAPAGHAIATPCRTLRPFIAKCNSLGHHYPAVCRQYDSVAGGKQGGPPGRSLSGGRTGEPPPLPHCWRDGEGRGSTTAPVSRSIERHSMRVQLKPVEDQIIVITGASSGIGLATAKMAAKHGARLVLVGRDEQALTRSSTPRSRRDGGEAIFVVADVADERRHDGGRRDALQRVRRVRHLGQQRRRVDLRPARGHAAGGSAAACSTPTSGAWCIGSLHRRHPPEAATAAR